MLRKVIHDVCTTVLRKVIHDECTHNIYKSVHIKIMLSLDDAYNVTLESNRYVNFMRTVRILDK